MSHNDQTQSPVPSPIELLYGAPAGSISPHPVPVKGIVAAFAGQEIQPQPIPNPGAITLSVPTAHTAPHPPRLTREEKARALVESGSVKLPDLPVGTILWTLRHGDSIPVHSQTDPSLVYHVNGVCQCADYARHQEDDPKWKCKHRLAAKFALLDRLEQETAHAKQAHEDDLLAAIPFFVLPRPRTWTEKEERIAADRERWVHEHVCRNESWYYDSTAQRYVRADYQ